MALLLGDERTRVVMLPRNERQAQAMISRFGGARDTGRMIIPPRAVDGLNLVWLSDLVISGGGTMNREAAALGVPVYSTFRGPTGAVDRYLASQGRLVLLESAADVRQRLVVAKRERSRPRVAAGSAALDAIVGHIATVAGGRRVDARCWKRATRECVLAPTDRRRCATQLHEGGADRPRTPSVHQCRPAARDDLPAGAHGTALRRADVDAFFESWACRFPTPISASARAPTRSRRHA